MGQFIIFIDIKVVHGYYNDTPGSFRFRLTDETERLIRSRKVLFVHTANRCQFMLENDCAGFLRGDKLELTLQSQDDNFMRLTQLNGYRPQTFYRLALSDDSQEIDIASAIVATEEQRGEAHFCHITIQLTDKMLEDAKAGKPQEYLLRFREVAYRWEYLFVPRYKSMDESKTLCLEDTQGKYFFTLPEKYTDPSLGGTMWRIFLPPPLCAESIEITTCNCQRCRPQNSPDYFPKHYPGIYSRKNFPSYHRKSYPKYFPKFSLINR